MQFAALRNYVRNLFRPNQNSVQIRSSSMNVISSDLLTTRLAKSGIPPLPPLKQIGDYLVAEAELPYLPDYIDNVIGFDFASWCGSTFNQSCTVTFDVQTGWVMFRAVTPKANPDMRDIVLPWICAWLIHPTSSVLPHQVYKTHLEEMAKEVAFGRTL